VPGKFIQGGDIRRLFGLPGAFSTYADGEFADESFAKKHTEPGLLGMCHRQGYANTNECQFYITLSAPLTFMDNKNVVFGRIVNGMRTIRMIEQQETYNEAPIKKVTIDAAAIYHA
jgi:cyclophilin family peptidyl-prolyl cis-trans isomerase